MSRYSRPQRTDRKTLRVFQANVGKIPAAHDCALALADSEQYDIILLQEPWTGIRDSRCLTKTHPAYDTFSPADCWNDHSSRPRVMTYIRRSANLLVDQKRPAASRDIVWLTINDTITIVNFYRQPFYDGALDTLLQLPIANKCLVAGDFNAKHGSWQTGRLDGRGDDIAAWALDNNLSLLNPADVPTNPHGNTIDLAFSNVPFSEATVEDHLATSSDHFTLSITIPGFCTPTISPGKILITTEEEMKRFVEIVQLSAVGIPTAASSPEDLDKLASSLADTLQSAAKAAGRQARKGGRGAPWWTEDCALAAAAFRNIRRTFPLGFNREVQLVKRDL